MSQMFIPVSCPEVIISNKDLHISTHNRACALHGIIVAQGICNKESIPTALLTANMTESKITLPKGMKIAEAHETETEKDTNAIEATHEFTPERQGHETPNLDGLDESKKALIQPVINQYKHLFGPVIPDSTTHGIEHSINLSTETPVRRGPYDFRNFATEQKLTKPTIHLTIHPNDIRQQR